MFIPRSVRGRREKITNTAECVNTTESTSQLKDEQGNDNDDIVLYSNNQRWPVTGEPVCIVCGRYGEYIVSDTNNDICSIQCKTLYLKQIHFTTATDQSHTVTTATDQSHTVTTAMDQSHTVTTATNQSHTVTMATDHSHTVTTATDQSHTVATATCTSYGESSNSKVVQSNKQITVRTDGSTVIASNGLEQAIFLRKQLGIIINSNATPFPITEFSQLSLIEQLLINLKEAEYIVMTPIQMQVIPCVISGHDMLVSSTTGSGKSLSFLLPLIHLLTTGSIKQILIICPTRELCIQLEEQSKQLMKGIPNMLTALLVGGIPLANQIHRLKSNIQVIIGTPGRLQDIISNHGDSVNITNINTLVLDEVDSLLEMGFDEQIHYILSKLPTNKQHLMFSATIPNKTETLANEILKNPICVSVGKPGSTCASIKHTILWIEEETKKKQLYAMIKDNDLFHPPAIVFVNSRKGSLLLAEALNKVLDIAAVAIHGEMDQSKRSYIFSGVRDGKYDIIVSTGLLARGIHLDNIRQVFIFDMPNTIEEFVHQVGRAGRLDSSGWAISYINNTNKGLFLDLIQLFEGDGNILLPQQLIQSPHVSKQQQRQHRKRNSTTTTTTTTRNPILELLHTNS